MGQNMQAMLIDLYGQYKGFNNGDFCASMKVMLKRGWNSNDQITKAIKELRNLGWIILTKQGGLRMGPNLYAVTFQPIDECNGKLDVSATATALGYWKGPDALKLKSPHRRKVHAAPPHGTAKLPAVP